MAQYALYRGLKADTTLYDSSLILQSFYSNAAATRLGWLSHIEAAVSDGDDSVASALLLSAPSSGTTTGGYGVKIRDLSSANAIVVNYIDYYNLYFKWHDSTLTSTDQSNLLILANKCPLTDGASIYQARALLRRINQNIVVYSDNCLMTDEERGGDARILGQPQMQQYTLMPNPNDGIMQLWQTITDNESLNIKVFNVVGAVVYTCNRKFEANMTTLDLSSIIPGIYNILLHESNGHEHFLRFIKK